MSDIEFVEGLFVKPPHEKAPDFVKMKISIKRKDLGNWLRGKTEEWINLDVKVSKEGKWYCAADNWKPTQGQGNQQKVQQGGAQEGTEDDNGFDDDIPEALGGEPVPF